MELGLGKADYASEPLMEHEMLALRSRQRLWFVDTGGAIAKADGL
jgi:hypothetical protein